MASSSSSRRTPSARSVRSSTTPRGGSAVQEVIRFAFLGFGLGALYSLASQGLVLIYRGSGVLNFAQGAVGMVGAFIAWEFQVRHGVPFLAAFVIGVAVSA